MPDNFVNMPPVSFGQIDRELAGPEGREEFGRAFGLLIAARGQGEEPDWLAGLDEREAALRSKVSAHYAVVRHLAEADPAAVPALRARVAAWGLDVLLSDFDRAFPMLTKMPVIFVNTPAVRELVIPEAPARSAASAEYLRDWERAMFRAAKRDYEGAAAELRRVQRESREDEVRREAAQDLEDLRAVGALYDSLRVPVPRGTAVTLEARDGVRGVRTIEGRVVDSTAERIEIVPADGFPVFVEVDDIPAVRLLRPTSEARPAALFLLLDGELHAAGARLGGTLDAAAPKYWIFARDLASRLQPPDAAELRRTRSALELLYAAEREFRSPRTRGAAVEKYRLLAADYAAVGPVLRSLPRIAERSEAYREYAFGAADVWGSGTFELRGGAWTSTASSDLWRAPANFVEVGYYAFPGVAYRAWVRAGGCCEETLQGFCQVTGLVRPHPQKPGATLPVEPGSKYGLPLRVPPLPADPKHAHAGRRAPSRWHWIEIPLPPASAAGQRRIRILTAQEGFSVSDVLVSSTRTAPP
jgi:hypothetical protein